MKKVNKSQRLQNVRYDVRGAVSVEAAKMEAAGEHVIKLNIGNPAAFGITGPESSVNRIESGAGLCQAYSDSKGMLSARTAIADYARRKGLPNVSTDRVYTGNGASEMIQLSMQALINPGDEILIPSPDYPLWTAAATMCGGNVRHYICDENSGWYPDTSDIEKKITPNTKAIVIINPNNPTGAVYPKELLEEIVGICRRHGLIIFSDEIYDRLLLSGAEHTSIASLAPDLLCITMNGLSKSHMLCGYRIGWMVLSGDISCAGDFIEGLDMLSNMRLCSNVPGQSVIEEALKGTARADEYFMPGGRLYEQVYGTYSLLSEIPGVTVSKPDAAFYLFPKIDTCRYPIKNDNEFALDFLRKEKVLIVPGNGFNWSTPGYFRVVCLPEMPVLADAVSRLGHYLSGLR